MHAREQLLAAPEPDEAPAAMTRSRAARAPGTGLEPPQPLRNFEPLQDEYQAYWDACAVRPGREAELALYIKRLNQGKAAYEQAGQNLGGIPWAFIGVIHGLECGFNFSGHLHNGDPLAARTVHVPEGHPQTGTPPFTWLNSAADALTLKGFQRITDWSIPRMLYLLERYNGLGYRMRRLPSPYLWSFSNHYEKGKFVADGRFDPQAVSKQCGAALMLKTVLSG